jgi:hypothetical protein
MLHTYLSSQQYEKQNYYRQNMIKICEISQEPFIIFVFRRSGNKSLKHEVNNRLSQNTIVTKRVPPH